MDGVDVGVYLGIIGVLVIETSGIGVIVKVIVADGFGDMVTGVKYSSASIFQEAGTNSSGNSRRDIHALSTDSMRDNSIPDFAL